MAIQKFSDFDRLTFRILARRWAANSPLPGAGAVTADDYRAYLQVHGLVGIVLRYHAADFEQIFGAQAATNLRRDYMLGAAKNARNLACLAAVASALEAGGLVWVVLKGAALSSLLYGDPNLRSSQDVDVLVDSADIGAALAALQRAGFAVLDEPLRRGRASGWRLRAASHHCQLQSPNGVLLELHWRSDFSRELSLPGLKSLAGSIQRVTVGTVQIPALHGGALATQVARHALRSLWLRWKWLYDTLETFLLVAGSDARLQAELLSDPSVRGSVHLAEGLMGLGSGTIAGRPASAAAPQGFIVQALALRDDEIDRHALAASGVAGPELSLESSRRFWRHLRFQSRAVASRSGRVRYLLWRMYRPLLER